MTSQRITFCIFAFNRGQFLENCIASIEALVVQPDIVVFDDHSDDPATCQYLKVIGERHQVVQPPKQGEIKHGGLYHNMQAALERLADRELLCFLQDDTQLVRPLGTQEIAELSLLFEQHENLGFVHPCFIRGIDLEKRPITMLPAQTPAVYFRKDEGQSAGVHYSDLLITCPRRLLARGWQFCQSEPLNDRQAKTLFGAMAYLRHPFAMWLPEVPAYRGKKKTLALKIAERKKQCGFYPFKHWSADELSDFVARPASDLPVAEHYLRCQQQEPAKPWTYNPLTGLRLLKHLNSIEVFLRRHLLGS